MMMEKKKLLDKIYYEIGKQRYDFHVCGLWQRPDGNRISTKWRKYSEAVFPIDFDGTCEDYQKQKFFRQINQRQILPNELVLDIEEPEKFPLIIEKLKNLRVPFKAYETGSRGYHIHLFFEKEVEKEEKLFYITHFGVDEQKAYSKTMIALEEEPHWKTGRIKTEIEKEVLDLNLSEFREKMGYSKPIPKVKKEDNSEEIKHHLIKNAVEKKWKKWIIKSLGRRWDIKRKKNLEKLFSLRQVN